MRGPDKKATDLSRRLRRSDNDAERALWVELHDRRLNGNKFVRQFPIGPYVADFACRERQLVVEVDGSQHAGSRRDRTRDDFMHAQGWSVLRIWNIDVLKAKEPVLATILAALEYRLDRMFWPPTCVSLHPRTIGFKSGERRRCPSSACRHLLPVKDGEKTACRNAGALPQSDVYMP